MLTSAAIALAAIVANVTAVYAAGPVGWAVLHFVALTATLAILLVRDNRKVAS